MARKIAGTKPFYNNEIPADWKLKELRKLGNFSKGKGILKDQVIESGLPCIRYGEIYTTHDYSIKEFKSFISEDLASESKEIAKGDILFAGSGETLEDIGKAVAYLGNEKAYAGGDIIILSTNETNNAEFIAFMLETGFVRRQKRRLGQGQSVVHIYPSDLATLKLPLPPSDEQETIADLLHLMDTAINKNNELIAKKELQKRGLMQYFLSEDYNSVNTQYERVKLSNFTKKYKGKVYEPSPDKSGLPCVTAASFDSNYTEFTLTSEAIKCDPNDVLVLWDGENAGAVTTGHDGVIGSTVAKLVLTAKLNNYYITYHLQYYNQKLRAIREGSGVPHMPGDFEDWYHFHIPPMEKQLEITKVLQAADTEIKLLKTKTNKLKEKKKGLMQQLLTGKVRLKIK